MYQNPTLFPEVTNRESWRPPAFLVWDDDAAQPIELRDPTLANSLYTLTLEISPSNPRSSGFPAVGVTPTPYYDDGCDPVITTSLAAGAPALSNSQLSIIDVGAIQIFLPKKTFSTLRPNLTYDVYLTVYDPSFDDGRQMLIGRLPVLYGGRTT